MTDNFLYRRSGGEWIVYAVTGDEYGDLNTLGEELARDRSVTYAEIKARAVLVARAEAEEKDRIALEFEEALFGLTPDERFLRNVRRDYQLSMVKSLLPALQWAPAPYVNSPPGNAIGFSVGVAGVKSIIWRIGDLS